MLQMPDPVMDLGFLKWGHQSQMWGRQPITWPIFLLKLHENEICQVGFKIA